MKARHLLLISVVSYVIFNLVAVTYGPSLDFSVNTVVPWHFYVAGLTSAIGFISLVVAVIFLIKDRKEETQLIWQWLAALAIVVANILIQQYFIG